MSRDRLPITYFGPIRPGAVAVALVLSVLWLLAIPVSWVLGVAFGLVWLGLVGGLCLLIVLGLRRAVGALWEAAAERHRG